MQGPHPGPEQRLDLVCRRRRPVRQRWVHTLGDGYRGRLAPAGHGLHGFHGQIRQVARSDDNPGGVETVEPVQGIDDRPEGALPGPGVGDDLPPGDRREPIAVAADEDDRRAAGGLEHRCRPARPSVVRRPRRAPCRYRNGDSGRRTARHRRSARTLTPSGRPDRAAAGTGRSARPRRSRRLPRPSPASRCRQRRKPTFVGSAQRT